MIEVQPPHLVTRGNPRDVLSLHFGSTIGVLPITGGWGYNKSDAVVINRKDETVDQEMPFYGVGYEYVFVEKRLYEELIVSRPRGEGYAGIKWKLTRQELHPDQSQVYDVLRFSVTALPDRDWAELKAEWESPDGYGSPHFNLDEHERRRAARTIQFDTEYWFEISSFYGQD